MTYLVDLILLFIKFDCCVRHRRRNHYLPLLPLAYESLDDAPISCRFDTDSFKIGVDSFASRCMANNPDYFEHLKLNKAVKRSVQGISKGLDIAGEGTFVLDIEDDVGGIHTIKVKNSLYVPELRFCLLSPQHWAQEAGGKQTRGMILDANSCILLWDKGQHRKTIPFNIATNTPIFRSAPSSHSYRAFVAEFEALRASVPREQVLLRPRYRVLERATIPDGDEFIAEENLHFDNSSPILEHEGDITSDDETIVHSNSSSKIALKTAPTIATPSRIGALTFDPSPQLEDDEQDKLVATDDQAELMRWHYCLGHLSFAKLKQLASNGEISKRFAKVKPPKCAGCIFGAMTKVPW